MGEREGQRERIINPQPPTLDPEQVIFDTGSFMLAVFSEAPPPGPTRNPKPETRNPKPEIRNPKSETRNPKSETRKAKPDTLQGYLTYKKTNPPRTLP